MNTYTATEMAERAGVSYRMLEYWRRGGYFGEEHRAVGTGKRDDGYTVVDLDRLRLFAALSAVGIPVADVWQGAHWERHGAVVTIHASPAVTIIVNLSEE